MAGGGPVTGCLATRAAATAGLLAGHHVDDDAVEGGGEGEGGGTADVPLPVAARPLLAGEVEVEVAGGGSGVPRSSRSRLPAHQRPKGRKGQKTEFTFEFEATVSLLILSTVIYAAHVMSLPLFQPFLPPRSPSLPPNFSRPASTRTTARTRPAPASTSASPTAPPPPPPPPSAPTATGASSAGRPPPS